MILVKQDIIKAVKKGDINISPFNIKQAGPNSYDVRLGKDLYMFNKKSFDGFSEYANYLDFECEDNKDLFNKLKFNKLKPEYDVNYGDDYTQYLLHPGEFYLGHTLETTHTNKYIPMLEGKSTTGRMGVQIHMTAGVGDIGFNGQWTLEIKVAAPVVVTVGMLIGQIIFYTPSSLPEEEELYNTKNNTYQGQQGVTFPKTNNYLLK